uniref:NADH-ubiquinone oxidoreductase chain 2 n=1 Tax=Parachtes limbarae TaxID=1110490 RepID=A0A516IMD2_9ARAC|nr:NADH dehydrogenase subunit 2 [Parachtes limbarae]
MNMPACVVYLSSFYLVFGYEEWFLIWLGLELNMISFLIFSHMVNNVVVVEAMVKYFFIQSLGSGLLLGMMYLGWNSIVWSLILMMSMGVGPFFGWYIKVVKSFTWWVNYILMIVQKVILLLLLVEVVSLFVFYMGMLSMIVGVFGVFGQVNMKGLMGYSSIFHGGWMFVLMEEKTLIWWLYFILYAMMMLGIISLLANQLFLAIGVSSGLSKYGFILLMLNLTGIPPFTGFIMKWVSFYFLFMFDYWLLIVMVVMSLVMLYVYLRFAYDVFLGAVFSSGWSINYSVFYMAESLGFVSFIFGFLV